jgi:MFS family permease
MKPLVRPTVKRFGFRTVLAVNGALAAIGVAVCALFTPAWPLTAIFLVLAIGGVTRSLQFTALATLAYADVPKEKLAPATAMSGTQQQLGQALGVVLGSLALEAALCGTGAATPGGGEFAIAFVIAGAAVLASVPFLLAMPRDAGADVSGHRH